MHEKEDIKACIMVSACLEFKINHIYGLHSDIYEMVKIKRMISPRKSK